MNSKIYCLSDKILLGRKSKLGVERLVKMLYNHNIRIDSISYLPNCPREDFDAETKREGKQNLIINVVDNIESYKLAINLICSKLQLEKTDSNKLKSYLTMKYSRHNTPMPKDLPDIWNVPSTAYVVENIHSDIQSFVVASKNDSYIVVPSDFRELLNIMPKIFNYLDIDKQKSKHFQAFKTLGLTSFQVSSTLSDLIKNKDKISITIYDTNLIVDIIVRSKHHNDKFDEYVSKIFSRLNKFIYAESDISMEEALFDLLRVNNKTVSICESATCGSVATRFLLCKDEAEKYLASSHIYSNINKMFQSMCDKHDFADETEAIYEISAKILQTSSSDIVASNYIDKKSGICLIAVGDKNAIHVYKNKFTCDDNLVENSICATYFYLIKKLRKNDFHFSQKNV